MNMRERILQEHEDGIAWSAYTARLVKERIGIPPGELRMLPDDNGDVETLDKSLRFYADPATGKLSVYLEDGDGNGDFHHVANRVHLGEILRDHAPINPEREAASMAGAA